MVRTPLSRTIGGLSKRKRFGAPGIRFRCLFYEQIFRTKKAFRRATSFCYQITRSLINWNGKTLSAPLWIYFHQKLKSLVIWAAPKHEPDSNATQGKLPPQGAGSVCPKEIVPRMKRSPDLFIDGFVWGPLRCSRFRTGLFTLRQQRALVKNRKCNL